MAKGKNSKDKDNSKSSFNIDKSDTGKESGFKIDKSDTGKESVFNVSKSKNESSFNIGKSDSRKESVSNSSKGKADEKSGFAFEKSNSEKNSSKKEAISKSDDVTFKGESSLQYKSKKDSHKDLSKKETMSNSETSSLVKEKVKKGKGSNNKIEKGIESVTKDNFEGKNKGPESSKNSKRGYLIAFSVVFLAVILYFILTPNSEEVALTPLASSEMNESADLSEIQEGSELLPDLTSALNEDIDSDGDGMNDAYEIANNLDPNDSSDADIDSDSDGLSNLSEMSNGLDPFTADSDNDGQSDSAEISQGSDPTDSKSMYSDRDKDGLSDSFETSNGLNPDEPNSGNSDSNGNGITDMEEMIKNSKIKEGAVNKSSYGDEISSINSNLNSTSTGNSAKETIEESAVSSSSTSSELQSKETSDNRGEAVIQNQFNSGDDLIYFDFNKSTIRNQNRLMQLVEFLKNTDNEILLVGHTDSTGSGEINFNISILRAETVKDYLINQGIETDRIKIDGEGETSPKYSNETSEGRRLNRRVQLIIQN